VDVGVEVQDMGAEGSFCKGERLKFKEAQRVQSMANDKVYFGLELCGCRFRVLRGIAAPRTMWLLGSIPG
jgi:hypothetical protein